MNGFREGYRPLNEKDLNASAFATPPISETVLDHPAFRAVVKGNPRQALRQHKAFSEAMKLPKPV